MAGGKPGCLQALVSPWSPAPLASEGLAWGRPKPSGPPDGVCGVAYLLHACDRGTSLLQVTASLCHHLAPHRDEHS